MVAPFCTFALTYAYAVIKYDTVTANDPEGQAILILVIFVSTVCLAIAIPLAVLFQRSLEDVGYGTARLAGVCLGTVVTLILFGIAYFVVVRQANIGSILVVPLVIGVLGTSVYFTSAHARTAQDFDL